MAEMGEHTGVLADAAHILAECGVQRVVEPVFDPPVTANGLGQGQRVGAKLWGDRLHLQPVQGVADRTVGGRAPPAATERLVQPCLVGTDERMNPAVRGRSAHHRQNTEQQQVGKIVQLPLRTTVIRNRQQALF